MGRAGTGIHTTQKRSRRGVRAQIGGSGNQLQQELSQMATRIRNPFRQAPTHRAPGKAVTRALPLDWSSAEASAS